MWSERTVCCVTIQILVLLLCNNVIKFVPVPRYLWDARLRWAWRILLLIIQSTVSPGLALKRTPHFKLFP